MSVERHENMRQAGKILAKILSELEGMVKPGLETMELEKRFLDLCKENKVIPACKGYKEGHKTAFPTGLCIGINNDCVHNAPKAGKILKEGDICVIDTVIELNGYLVDAARVVAVGKVSDERERLISTAHMAFDAAVNVAKVGGRVGDISNAMQTVIEMAGFTPLRGFTGHGVGESMHEEPNIPCFGKKGTGEELVEGMTLAIEPLICAGGYEVGWRDEWQTYLKDGSDFAQYENTVLLTTEGPKILTKE